jgi:hypothetical protein
LDWVLLRDRVAGDRSPPDALGGVQIGQFSTKRLWRQKVGTPPSV